MKLTGLSSQQVKERISKNLTNDYEITTTKSIKEIITKNTFTVFNLLNILIALLIITTGSYKNLLFIGVVIINISVGTYREIKAKKSIDSLSLLNQAKVTVLRDGKLLKVAQKDIVIDDIIYLESGSQIVVDGKVVESSGFECDESALTGESDAITKNIGDLVYSGSYVISGNAYIQATKIGIDSYIAQLTLKAKSGKSNEGVLLNNLNHIIKLLSYFIIPIGTILFITSLMKKIQYNEAILGSTAAMIGMIPEGLILITTVALAIGAIRLTKENVLIKSIGSIETLARINVLCLDKTGTITTNRLKFIKQIDIEQDISDTISQLIYGINDHNATSQALFEHYSKPSNIKEFIKIIPFSSLKKWSAIQYQDISYYLGAPDYLTKDETIQNQIDSYTNQGYRVIALAKSQQPLSDSLPNDLKVLGFIVLEDEIRNNAAQTLAYFEKQNVQLKIISGDYYKTVEKIAIRAGLKDVKAVDMSKIADNADYEALVAKYQVFGRVTPEQKKKLVIALQKNNTVGMTGDGVNDILALKQADSSIVMNNANDAVKGIADFVLLSSSFDSMINILLEGRRVVNNIQRVAALFLTKTVYSIVLAFIFIFLTNPYPIQPIQLTPINALLVGFPSFLLAFRSDFRLIKGNFIKNALKTALASGFTIIFLILAIQVLASYLKLDYAYISTLSIISVAITLITTLFYLAKPLNKIIISSIIFLAIFLVTIYLIFNKFFNLVYLLDANLMILYLPIIIIAPILFFLLLKVSNKLLNSPKKIHTQTK